MNAAEVNGLLELAERLAEGAERLRDALRSEYLTTQIREVIDEDYDLGRLTRFEQNLRGAVNVSGAVWTRDETGEHRYFVRKYNEIATEPEICFEHALVKHMVQNGFHLAAEVLENKYGETFVTREETRDGEARTCYFAVYECLSGEDKYDWFENRLADVEFEEGGRVLARFHHAVVDFDPGDLARAQPPIMEFVATLAETFRGWLAGGRGTVFDEHVAAKLPEIMETIERGLGIGDDLEGAPRLPVHCDYHPGNLKWVDERAVALFDFDWSKIDYRVFDVAEGVAYFCTSWEGEDSGELWLDKTELFLRAYQKEAASHPDPGPLTPQEIAVLPRMIAIANLYVLNWDLSAYYEDPAPNVDKLMRYLRHNVMVLEFIEDHMGELTDLVNTCANAA